MKAGVRDRHGSHHGKTIPAPCNACGPQTNHSLLAEYRFPEDKEEAEEFADRFQILRCRGCDGLVVRRDWWNVERRQWLDPTFYPPRISRRAPNWAKRCDRTTRQLLHEIYAALNGDSLVLATIGVRTLLDHTMLRLVGDGGFKQKLENMQRGGYIGVKEHQLLSDLIEIGHAAAHRGHRPSKKHIAAMLGVVEGLLERLWMGTKIRSARHAAPSRKQRLATTTIQ